MQKYNYDKWYLSGHSLGGVVACIYAAEKPENITGIIGFASYTVNPLPQNIEYISFYGSEDKVLNLTEYEKHKIYFPDNYKEYVTDG